MKVQTVQTVYTDYPQKNIVQRGVTKKVLFLGKPECEPKYPDYQVKIPDPIYTFFDELPKYELHSHFNGATPLNISKLFLNKEGKFIGTSADQLERKYDSIRKNSTSLADWLDKTYELKAKNITSMDITTAAYAIAMEEAKHNCRYLEVRIDPYSSSFVGSPEDILRAAEAGLKNAREDIKEQGKELSTSLIILAERHASPEVGMRSARLATKLRSQRVLFDKMYKEFKAVDEQQLPFNTSEVLNREYIEFIAIAKLIKNIRRYIEEVHTADNVNRERLLQSLHRTRIFLNMEELFDKLPNVPSKNIEALFRKASVQKDRQVSTIDLVPIVYSAALNQVKAGKKSLTIGINPFDPIYLGAPEDILRAVQVGLRNAIRDLAKQYPELAKDDSDIRTSIVIEFDPDKFPREKAVEVARLTVKMKSQRVMFEQMYTEMKATVEKDDVYNDSKLLNGLAGDLNLVQQIRDKINIAIETPGSTEKEIITLINKIQEEDLPKITTSNALIKISTALNDLKAELLISGLTDSNKSKIAGEFDKQFTKAVNYLEEKTFIAKKIFDNLRHNSILRLEDKKHGTKTADRYLRMGSGVIPNVTGLAIDKNNGSGSKESLRAAIRYLTNYNDRKPFENEQVNIYTEVEEGIRLEDAINNPDAATKTLLTMAQKGSDTDMDPFDETAINTVYSTSKITEDIESLIEMVQDKQVPDQFLKQHVSRTLSEINDKIKTQHVMHEQRFLLAKRIYDNLNHYSQLTIQDRQNGTKDAKRFSRMGVDIIPNVVGFDFAGNENKFPIRVHERALNHIKYYNERKQDPQEQLKVTIHAGEVHESGDEKQTIPGWQNILDAMKLGAHRIGHGIDLRNAPQWLKGEVKRRNVLMETCPKVNFQTKAVEGYRNHPVLDFLDEGIPANINTDNPVTAGTNLTNEFVKVFKRFNYNITPEERAQGTKERLTLGHIKQIIHNSIWSAFGLTPQEKAAEEAYAMHQVDELVHKFEDKVVLKDNEPIMMKVQQGVVAFTGRIKLAISRQIDKNKVA